MVESNNTNTLNSLHGPNCGRRVNNGLKDQDGFYDAYSTGYYAQIKNLPEGTHEIKFGGSFLIEAEGEDPLPIQVSVTDIITVVDTECDYLL